MKATKTSVFKSQVRDKHRSTSFNVVEYKRKTYLYAYDERAHFTIRISGPKRLRAYAEAILEHLGDKV